VPGVSQTIRPARPGERDLLRGVLLAATGALGYPEHMMAEVRRLVEGDPAIAPPAIAAGRVLIAEDEGEIVGFAAVEPPDAAGRSELTGLFVAPGRWRVGIGSALVAAASARAAAWGARALRVEGSSGFYARTGWRIVGETGTALGPRAWIMERPVTPGRAGPAWPAPAATG
jgi:predicted N-acetyltransferase YhbS